MYIFAGPSRLLVLMEVHLYTFDDHYSKRPNDVYPLADFTRYCVY